MNFQEALELFPSWNKMRGLIQPLHLEKLRIVTDHDLMAYGADFEDLPLDIQKAVLGPEGFSGFNHPSLPAHFVLMSGRIFPNLAYQDKYPGLLDISFDQAVSANHWMWFGGYRKVHLRESHRAISWLKPQTNYQLPDSGHFRRGATSTLLLGREWISSGCPCGPACLRPDHWRQREDGIGKGRYPRLNIRNPKRTT